MLCISNVCLAIIEKLFHIKIKQLKNFNVLTELFVITIKTSIDQKYN
jgi:hypothetical protein